jgi:hypothetical protein
MSVLAEAWLAELGASLRLTPARNRRVLEELSGHLREATESETRRTPGIPPEEAERRAVAGMGPAAGVAARFEAELGVPPLWLRLIVQALRLGALALLVTGLSGLLAEPVGRIAGMDFFFGDERPLAERLSTERCAQLLRLQPGQPTCADALVEHHYGEMVESGLVAAILGALALAALRRIRGHVEPVGARRARLDAFTAGAGALGFVVLAALDLPAGLRGALAHAPGAGRPLFSGAAAGVLALLLAWTLARAARRASA